MLGSFRADGVAAVLVVLLGGCGEESASGAPGPSSGGAGGGGAGGGGAASSSSGGGQPPGEAEVAFVGRVDRTERGSVRFSWSGAGLRFRFTGTEATVTLDDPSHYLTLVVDGAERPRVATTAGPKPYVLAEGLAPGEHEIELYRRTEASFGVTRFLGLDLGAGTLLSPPAVARRIELVGDSISCGYGNEGADKDCPFSPETENHYLTYGAIAARNLGAELSTVAWSGKGVLYNYGDDKTDPMPKLYDRALATDPSSTWDFAWKPDVVVINLGTNDFSTDGDPAPAEFSAAYAGFLATIRERYPAAQILALTPTLLSGADLDTAREAIADAVASRSAAGDAKVTARSLTFDTMGYGCSYHPSLATHASMAASLAQELEQLMGW